MQTIRSLMHPRSFVWRTLITVGLSLAVIVGLLAMHTMSTHHLGPANHADHSAVTSDTRGDVMTAHADDMTEPCDCDSVAPAQDHSAMTVACVLALLATLLLIAAPRLLRDSCDGTRHLSTLSQRARRALAQARPPSLLVLSISRT